MAQTLTDEQKAEIKEAFNFFDKDKDGSIDITELNNVMKSLGKNPTDSELQSLMKGVDSDGDGMINYEEFQNMMAKSMRNTNLKETFKVMKIGFWINCMLFSREESNKQMVFNNDWLIVFCSFQVFDKDGDGFISKVEIKQTMIQLHGQVLTDLELDEMMSEGDIDSDGRISYEEFAKLMDISTDRNSYQNSMRS